MMSGAVLPPYRVMLVGLPELAEAVDVDPRFSQVASIDAAQAVIVAAAERHAAPEGAQQMPVLLQRHQPAIRSARAVVASGRVGLPWHVQADFVVNPPTGGGVDRLLAGAVEPLDIVLRMAGLPIRRVMARPSGLEGVRAITLHSDHDNDVTSTVLVAGSALGGGDGGIRRHRYRISGSQGLLTVDATKPRLTVSRSDGNRSGWDGLRVTDGWLDSVAADLRNGEGSSVATDLDALDTVIAAARTSLRTGTTTTVKA